MGKNEATKYSLEKKHTTRDPSYRRMQGNFPAKKYQKGTPSVLRLSFEFTGGTTQFIDIAKALSIINRRLYRQGCYYYVNSVELYNDEDAFVDIHTLPDNWITRAAYRRGKGVFDAMNEYALQHLAPSVVPKYYDFKVYMSDRHRTTGSANPNLYNINSTPLMHQADDWEYSQLVSADSDGDLVIDPITGHATGVNQEADNFFLHMIGGNTGSSDNWTSVGLIQSYADSRARVHNESPAVPADVSEDPLTNLFEFSSEEMLNDVIDRLEDDNDNTPYDQSVYVGESVQSMQHVGRLVTTTTIGRKDSIDGFCAPIGLICVDPQATATAYRIVINLAPGTYHGVYAERMA